MVLLSTTSASVTTTSLLTRLQLCDGHLHQAAAHTQWRRWQRQLQQSVQLGAHTTLQLLCSCGSRFALLP